MTNTYRKQFFAGWGDMDFNAHMRNTAYLDKSGDIRMMFFSEHGFPMAEFVQMKFGPVVMKDHIEYYREVQLLEELTVSLSVAGLSPDGSRWIIQNDFFRSGGKPAAKVTSEGGWLDLETRKLVPPPNGLKEALNSLPRTTDYRVIGI